MFTGNVGVDLYPPQFVEVHGVDKFFSVLKKSLGHGLLDHVNPLAKRKSMIVCGGCQEPKDGSDMKGLCGQHAYSVLDAITLVSGTHLIQLRNPWGHGEWSGRYSDNDKSNVRWMETAGMSMLGMKPKKEDGKFWMCVEDFVKYFPSVQFVGTSLSIENTRMDMHEESGLCGPFKGCVLGTGTFCCMCEGIKTMCCPERRTTLKMLADAGLPGDRCPNGKVIWNVYKYDASTAIHNEANADASWHGIMP